ncbi:MAG: CHASE sensor domain-containing protein, partial [Mariprofundus sp.]|nr:CHASE sensor domain-containing protein [Mariprofundus sp.]
MSRNISTTIQRQLQLFLALTLSLTVLVMGGVWIGYNQVSQKNEEVRTLTIEGDMIGAAARPALMFNDRRMASELLSNIHFDSDISVVKLFRGDGSTLFTYVADGDSKATSQAPFQSHQSIRFDKGHLLLYRVVEHKGDVVGVVYLESRLGHLKENRNSGLITVAAVIGLCLLLGLAFAARLQEKIVTPISKLADLMRQVGESRDYSLRSTHHAYNRETEELLSGFNQMADEIQRSFVTIKAQNEALKQSEQLLRNMIEMAPMPVL